MNPFFESLADKFFGLSPDEDGDNRFGEEYEEDEPSDSGVNREEDDQEDEEEEEGPSFFERVRNFFGGKNNEEAEEDEDEEEDEERGTGSEASSSASSASGDSGYRRRTQEPPRSEARFEQSYRPSSAGKTAQQDRQSAAEISRMRVIHVKSKEECGRIIKFFMQSEGIVVCVDQLRDNNEHCRVVDLLSGAVFALEGNITRLTYDAYLLAPRRVGVVDETPFHVGQAASR